MLRQRPQPGIAECDTNLLIAAGGAADAGGGNASPAARAGLRADDFILSLNGQTVGDASQLQRLLADQKPGSTVQLEIFRDLKRVKITVPVSSTQQQKRGR